MGENTMNSYIYEVNCTLNTDPFYFGGVSSELEVSLPCINCQRDYRTIVFRGIGEEGICTPRAKCDGFPGTMKEIKVNRLSDKVEIIYTIDFSYEVFKDKQLGKEPVLGKYGWARVNVSAKCEMCGEESLLSTQENMVRPHAHKCTCGHTLIAEAKSPFTYFVKEKS